MWKTLNYEVLGRSHYKAKKVCQDKTYTYNEDGVVAIALADGAGSQMFSDIGAMVACKSICEFVATNFERLAGLPAYTAREQIIEHILDKLEEKAQELNCSKDALASTLLCVVVKNERIIAFHVGDGVIGYIKNNALIVLSAPDNGEYANSTYFVTSQLAIKQSKIFHGAAKGISGFILLSDGSSTALYEKQRNRMSQAARKIIDGLQYMNPDKMFLIVKNLFDFSIVEKTTDDCSVAVLANNEITKEDFDSLDRKEKCLLFDLGISSSETALEERFEILKYTSTPKTLDNISKKMNLGRRKTAYRLKHLVKLGMVEKENDMYHSHIV